MIQEYKPLYTVKETAEVLGTNRNYVYKIINNGELPYLLINNAKRIRGSDLEKYIENMPTEECG